VKYVFLKVKFIYNFKRIALPILSPPCPLPRQSQGPTDAFLLGAPEMERVVEKAGGIH
jgi:hypothetical protein